MKIENNNLSLSVKLEAAEMTSLIDKKSGQEVLWQGDPAFWAGRNPILFPIVGSTFDKKIHIDGNVYEMGNHGFARNSTFALVSETENEIKLSLESNDQTLAQYPYHFNLSVRYTLKDKIVFIDYFIENKDEKVMPFSFGLHPAFALDDPNSARLEFPEKEDDSQLQNGRFALMDDAFFETKPTYLLENIRSRYVDLIRKDLKVRVSCMGYRWIAFWKKPGAKFLCIEPWHGHGDVGETTTDFASREGTIHLKPGQTYTTSYSISIL